MNSSNLSTSKEIQAQSNVPLALDSLHLRELLDCELLLVGGGLGEASFN